MGVDPQTRQLIEQLPGAEFDQLSEDWYAHSCQLIAADHAMRLKLLDKRFRRAVLKLLSFWGCAMVFALLSERGLQTGARYAVTFVVCLFGGYLSARWNKQITRDLPPLVRPTLYEYYKRPRS